MAGLGIRATPEQLTTLRAHRAPALAAEAPVHQRTSERALAGEPVHPLSLRALLEAAERLAKQPRAAGAGQ